MRKSIFISILLFVFAGPSLAQDPGWPRQKSAPAGKLVCYQPQFVEWNNFKELTFSMAFSLAPAGAKAVVGVVDMHALTIVNVDDHSVLVSDFVITGTHLHDLRAGPSLPWRPWNPRRSISTDLRPTDETVIREGLKRTKMTIRRQRSKSRDKIQAARGGLSAIELHTMLDKRYKRHLNSWGIPALYAAAAITAGLTFSRIESHLFSCPRDPSGTH